MASDLRVEMSPVGPVIQPPKQTDLTVLYFHGGTGHDAGQGTAERIARATGASVVCPRYRSTFPEAFADAQAGYDYCAQTGPVVVVGKRIGAALAGTLLVHLRDQGTAPPQRTVLISGLLDLTLRANSLVLNARADPAYDVTRLRQRVSDYAVGADRTDPLVSPLYANLHGLAPIQLLVAGTDPLLDDSLAFATRAARSRVAVDLRVWPDPAGLRAEALPVMAEFITTPRASVANAMSV